MHVQYLFECLDKFHGIDIVTQGKVPLMVFDIKDQNTLIEQSITLIKHIE